MVLSFEQHMTPPRVSPSNRGYYCSRCKGRHAKQETIKQCWADYYAATGKKPEVVDMSNLGNNMHVDPADAWSSISNAKLPTGNYLTMVTLPSGNRKSVHIRIGVLDSGKWSGSYFVSMYDESTQKLVPIRSKPDRIAVINKLVVGNWRRQLLDYGRTFGECPICGGPLPVNEINSGVHRTEACYSKVYG